MYSKIIIFVFIICSQKHFINSEEVTPVILNIVQNLQFTNNIKPSKVSFFKIILNIITYPFRRLLSFLVIPISNADTFIFKILGYFFQEKEVIPNYKKNEEKIKQFESGEIRKNIYIKYIKYQYSENKEFGIALRLVNNNVDVKHRKLVIIFPGNADHVTPFVDNEWLQINSDDFFDLAVIRYVKQPGCMKELIDSCVFCVQQLLKYQPENIVINGNSLGGALSMKTICKIKKLIEDKKFHAYYNDKSFTTLTNVAAGLILKLFQLDHKLTQQIRNKYQEIISQSDSIILKKELKKLLQQISKYIESSLIVKSFNNLGVALKWQLNVVDCIDVVKESVQYFRVRGSLYDIVKKNNRPEYELMRIGISLVAYVATNKKGNKVVFDTLKHTDINGKGDDVSSPHTGYIKRDYLRNWKKSIKNFEIILK